MDPARRPARATARRTAAFVVVLAGLFVASWAEGAHGLFSSAERRLQGQLDDPATRANATVEISTRLATALAEGEAVFPGRSDVGTCPGRVASEATSVIAGLPADQAGAIVAGAATKLRDTGWTVDAATPGDRRVAIRAHNRRGLVVAVSRDPGNDATTITVSVTVPCEALRTPGDGSTTTTTTGS